MSEKSLLEQLKQHEKELEGVFATTMAFGIDEESAQDFLGMWKETVTTCEEMLQDPEEDAAYAQFFCGIMDDGFQDMTKGLTELNKAAAEEYADVVIRLETNATELFRKSYEEEKRKHQAYFDTGEAEATDDADEIDDTEEDATDSVSPDYEYLSADVAWGFERKRRQAELSNIIHAIKQGDKYKELERFVEKNKQYITSIRGVYWSTYFDQWITSIDIDTAKLWSPLWVQNQIEGCWETSDEFRKKRKEQSFFKSISGERSWEIEEIHALQTVLDQLIERTSPPLISREVRYISRPYGIREFDIFYYLKKPDEEVPKLQNRPY